jgi:hypothetical protein
MDGPRYIHNRGDIMYAVPLYAPSSGRGARVAPAPEGLASKPAKLDPPTA